MREKIAQWFFYRKYEPSSDALAYNLRWEDIPFDGCPSKEPFYKKAAQFLTLISEEIEKGLLTDEEIEVAYWKYSWGELADIFPDTSGRMIDLRRKAVAQAQLQKILALLKK